MRLEEISSIKARLQLLRDGRDHLVFDGDTHPTDFHHLDPVLAAQMAATPDYYQGRPIAVDDLLKEMDAAGVDMANCWQNPAALVYDEETPDADTRMERNYELLLQANRDIHQFSVRFPKRIFPSGWTDPKALGVELAKQLAEICILELGFLIVKMNPAQNAFPMDSDEILEVTERIFELGGIVAFHYGGDTHYTPPEALGNLARQYPDRRIIAVHMGGGGSHYVDGDETYVKTRELGLEYPNLFFVLSAIRDCHIESNLIRYELEGAPFSRNIACGSDAPYGKVAWNYGGYERMFKALMNHDLHPDPRVRENPGLFTNDSVQNYLGRNFADMAIRGYEELLRAHGLEDGVMSQP